MHKRKRDEQQQNHGGKVESFGNARPKASAASVSGVWRHGNVSDAIAINSPQVIFCSTGSACITQTEAHCARAEGAFQMKL